MKKELFEIEKGLSDENSTCDFKADTRLEEFENDDNILISENFLIKNDFLKDLFPVDPEKAETEFCEEEKKDIEVTYSSDNIIISGWKNVENISARLIDYYTDTVMLECLIDKDNGIFEEREFRFSLFEGYKMEIGNLFLLRIFERQNEIRIEIHNDPGLTLKDDFPQFSFVEKFKDSRLFKKK